MRIFFICLAWSVAAFADDWPMGGRSQSRNPVSPEKNAPIDWQFSVDGKPAKNIRWSAKVGNRGIGGPIVANGLVWVGTNNDAELDPKITDDRGVLACFRESDGKFLYQYSTPRLKSDQNLADWSGNGLSCTPIAEGHKLWFMTNRREVVCLDTEPLSKGTGPAKELWKYDLVKEQKVFPNSPMIPSHHTLGSFAIHKHLLFVQTGNGINDGHTKVVSPDAPCLVCFDKSMGKVVWKDNSPGKDGMGGHHASPLIIETKDGAQVIHGQGDGWVRSFEAATGKLIWKFDLNRKGAKWTWGEQGRQILVAPPVYADGRVYFGVGKNPEASGGAGRLFCIDPSKKGDVSPELDDGNEKGKPNPASAVIWEFTNDGDKKSEMHETTSSVAVEGGLVIALDRQGYIHCLDTKTGKRLWSHDAKASIYGEPLIVDGKVYVASEGGELTTFELSRAKKVIAKHEFDSIIVAPPVFANGTLFVLTETTLRAIGAKK